MTRASHCIAELSWACSERQCDARRPGGAAAHQCGHQAFLARFVRTDSRKVCYRTTVLGVFWPVWASFGAFSISFGAFWVGFERHFEARSASRAHWRGCAANSRDARSGAHVAGGVGVAVGGFRPPVADSRSVADGPPRLRETTVSDIASAPGGGGHSPAVAWRSSDRIASRFSSAMAL